MKPILTEHILPLFLACFIVCLAFALSPFPGKITGSPHRHMVQQIPVANDHYIPALLHIPENEQRLREALESGTLVILGSSELTETSYTLPYRFVPETMRFPVLGVGHAGYQSMAMLATLGSMTAELRHARVLIILSPGWFEDLSSKGTNISVFLENLSDPMLEDLIRSPELPHAFKLYVAGYVAGQISNITRASTPYRYLYHLSASGKNLISNTLHKPFLVLNGWWMSRGMENLFGTNGVTGNDPEPDDQAGISGTQQPVTAWINWDSLIDQAGRIAGSRSSTNQWGIEDDYYLTYIRGNHGSLRPVPPARNRELHDLGMLVRLLKQFDCKATFVIQPLNPYYYQPLTVLQPTIQAITDTLSAAGFPCLNLFEADTTRYQKALLRDVMHMDDAAWYQINRFIEDQYINHE